jgi:hypothetical protein
MSSGSCEHAGQMVLRLPLPYRLTAIRPGTSACDDAWQPGLNRVRLGTQRIPKTMRWAWHGPSWLPQVHTVDEAFKDLLPCLFTNFLSTNYGLATKAVDSTSKYQGLWLRHALWTLGGSVRGGISGAG